MGGCIEVRNYKASICSSLQAFEYLKRIQVGRIVTSELGLPVYKFLEGPLTRRFGKEWCAALCEVADHFDECNTSAT